MSGGWGKWGGGRDSFRRIIQSWSDVVGVEEGFGFEMGLGLRIVVDCTMILI
jgi:hypothetical protein